MVSFSKPRERGIALIQVLIISIILAMLGIFITQTVRSQVASASLMKNSSQVLVAIENAQAELLHTLLTNKHYQDKRNENDLVKSWNFYGKPFQYDEVTKITIQDLSSLLSLNHTHTPMAASLFRRLGYQGHEVRTFLDSLADWKDKDELKRLNGAEAAYYQSVEIDGPRNGYLQSISEVLSIKQASMLSSEQWHEYFSLSLVSEFNPMNAPAILLYAFINNEQAFESVIEQRENGTLTPLSFYQTTGIDEDDGVKFSTGRTLKINIMTEKKNVKFNKNFIVELRPQALKRALTLSNVTWNKE